MLCTHGGTATPLSPNPRVTVSGQPTVTLPPPWSIAGCPYPPNSGGPCVTAQWTVGAMRVTSNGQPLLLATGAATCVPTGVPLNVVAVQTRVIGS